MFKGNNIRLLIAAGLVSLLAIFILQMLWMQKTIAVQETNIAIQNKEDSLSTVQFSQQVRIALKDVLEDIYTQKADSSDLFGAVKQLRTNYFVVDINEELYPYYLETLLKREFYNQGVEEDFQYGIYDCFSDSIVYGDLIRYKRASVNSSNEVVEPGGYTSKDSLSTSRIPEVSWKKDGHYFSVFFPNIVGNKIESQGELFSPVLYVLFIVIIVGLFFYFSVSLLMKQRRITNTKNDFINNMTHELKTPIATIGLSSEMLLKDIEKDNNYVSRYANIIYKENKRLENQVERVLNIAKLEKDELHLKNSKIDVHELLQEVADNFEFNQADAGGEIILNLHAEKFEIISDEVHLSNVLYNLIDNAIKYCENSPRIVCSTINEKNSLIVEIEDNGIGIPGDDLPHIFDKFFRVHTGNRHDVKGFGLGLFYVKTVIEAVGGNIQVKSELNKGTSFKIKLS